MSSTSSRSESEVETAKASKIENKKKVESESESESEIDENKKKNDEKENETNALSLVPSNKVEEKKIVKKKKKVNKVRIEDENTIETLVSKDAHKKSDSKITTTTTTTIEAKSKHREWERSTRIDKKLGDLYAMSGLYEGDFVPEEPKKDKKHKKIKRKKSAKKRDDSRVKSAPIARQESSDSSVKKPTKKVVSDSDDDTKLDSHSTSKSKEEKPKRKDSTADSNVDETKERQPPLLYPPKPTRKEKDSAIYKTVIKNSINRIGNKSSTSALYKSYLIRDACDECIEHHLCQTEAFYKRNEVHHCFMKSLRKDIRSYMDAKIKEERFNIIYRDFADDYKTHNRIRYYNDTFDDTPGFMRTQHVTTRRITSAPRLYSKKTYVASTDENLLPIEKYFYLKK